MPKLKSFKRLVASLFSLNTKTPFVVCRRCLTRVNELTHLLTCETPALSCGSISLRHTVIALALPHRIQAQSGRSMSDKLRSANKLKSVELYLKNILKGFDDAGFLIQAGGKLVNEGRSLQQRKGRVSPARGTVRTGGSATSGAFQPLGSSSGSSF